MGAMHQGPCIFQSLDDIRIFRDSVPENVDYSTSMSRQIAHSVEKIMKAQASSSN